MLNFQPHYACTDNCIPAGGCDVHDVGTGSGDGDGAEEGEGEGSGVCLDTTMGRRRHNDLVVYQFTLIL